MIISVRVRPGKRQNLVTQTDGGFLVDLRAQPVDGKANAALVCVLAEHFGVRKQDVKIKSGKGSREKLVSISRLAEGGGPEGT